MVTRAVENFHFNPFWLCKKSYKNCLEDWEISKPLCFRAGKIWTSSKLLHFGLSIRTMMDRHSDIVSDDNSSAARHGNTRLLVTHDGQLDKALLRRTEGYMHKKGGAVNARGGFRNWKKRWFVIAEVEVLGAQGYELQYYDAPHGNLKGKVGLSEIEIQCEAKSQHKKVKYEFQIVLQNGGTLELSCDDANERDEWVETLNMITAYLRKILTTQAMTLDGYDPFDEDDEESFNIGEEIAQNCQAFGPGLFGAEAGVQSQFVIQVTLKRLYFKFFHYSQLFF